MELVDFAPTRSVGGVRGDDQSVLEISDIRNPEVLADEPLEIEIEAGLGEDEYLLPIAFDGEHLHFVGHPSKTESGKVSVSIDEIPEVADDRRSIGRAIKFYFFKSYLKFREVNRLAWIEYKDDGTFERHDDGVKEKVAKSKRVLLLIHGIIGNTDGIVEGLKLARDGSGRSVDQKYDVVLTYDYENLSTPIEETARELKRQLGEVGLRVGDDRELVIVCHSMGGLVSRWFIEQEGGKDFVDELVMFGTPNVGSPFGRVDMARDLMSMLTTLAINTFPAVAAFGGALVYLLTRSKKLTPTLEQMHPDSEFITKLKRGADPRVRYRIIAGDVRHYDASGDAVTARLVAKLGRGKLFGLMYGNRGHDIAVADESILGVDDHRIHPAQKDSVICHHMNYFASDAGLAKLRDV
jgi:pimeloyl-ACP methyl ester carboxylesterase